jgi:hypothetical protein
MTTRLTERDDFLSKSALVDLRLHYIEPHPHILSLQDNGICESDKAH